jgi:hypothetical protein
VVFGDVDGWVLGERVGVGWDWIARRCAWYARPQIPARGASFRFAVIIGRAGQRSCVNYPNHRASLAKYSFEGVRAQFGDGAGLHRCARQMSQTIPVANSRHAGSQSLRSRAATVRHQPRRHQAYGPLQALKPFELRHLILPIAEPKMTSMRAMSVPAAGAKLQLEACRWRKTTAGRA